MNAKHNTLQLAETIGTLIELLAVASARAGLSFEPTRSHGDVADAIHELEIIVADLKATARDALTWGTGVKL
jgi:hypothetical protein